MSQIYPEPTLPDPGREQFEKTNSNDQGPAAAATAVLWVVFLTTLAIAPALVIAAWKELL